MPSVTGKQKQYRISCMPSGLPTSTPAMGHGISAEMEQKLSNRLIKRRKLSTFRGESCKYAYSVYNGNGYDPVLNNEMGYMYFYSEKKLAIGTTFECRGRQWEVFKSGKCRLIAVA